MAKAGRIDATIMRIRWYVLMAVIACAAFWYGTHVQQKIDQQQELTFLEQLGRKLKDAPENMVTIARDPAALTNLEVESERFIDNQNNHSIHLVGQDSIPVDKSYLYSTYDYDRDLALVILQRLNSNEIEHQWSIQYELLAEHWQTFSKRTCPCFEHTTVTTLPKMAVKSPTLLPNGNLVVDAFCHLCCFDRDSQLLWTIDRLNHHSVEVDHTGNIWTCGRQDHALTEYFVDTLLHVDAASGKILFETTLNEIFLANPEHDLSHHNRDNQDPFHLNDVQPVLVDSDFWQQGDLFLSLRNINTVLLYRPSENRILWRNSTFWSYQHDVNILDEETITVFDNNVTPLPYPSVRYDFKHGRFNRCMTYNFRTGEVKPVFTEQLEHYDCHTQTEGRFHWLKQEQLAYLELDNQDFFLIIDLQTEETFKCLLPGRTAEKAGFLNWYRLMD